MELYISTRKSPMYLEETRPLKGQIVLCLRHPFHTGLQGTRIIQGKEKKKFHPQMLSVQLKETFWALMKIPAHFLQDTSALIKSPKGRCVQIRQGIIKGYFPPDFMVFVCMSMSARLCFSHACKRTRCS